MDQVNQQTYIPYNNAGDVSSVLWPSKLARLISLPLTRMVSSSLNNYRVFIDEDFVAAVDGDSFPAPFLEECLHSRPFLVLDVVWNLAFVIVAVFVLLTTLKERPLTPLRLWVAGYAFQCLLHLGFVWIDYQITLFYDRFVLHPSRSQGIQDNFPPFIYSFMKRLESFTTVMSTVWWLVGFYWIAMGGQELLQDSPRLYWLSVVYLAFDLFFMIFCIGLACIMFTAVFCFFPILATVAYAITMHSGASENDIKNLPKYKYNQEASFNLGLEDSECCICLHEYEDRVELCTLPCHHHFHYWCIRKWLKINATCPLCKCNMLHGETLV